MTGARIIKAGAYDAYDPAARLHTVVVNELGETVDLKTVKDADRRRLFGGEARYTATDLENRSISIDVESVAPKYKYPYYGPIFQGTPTNDPTLIRK